MDWVQLIQSVGVPLALVVFFVVEGKRREDRMAARLTEVENYVRTDMSRINHECITALNRNSDCLEHVKSWLEDHQ